MQSSCPVYSIRRRPVPSFVLRPLVLDAAQLSQAKLAYVGPVEGGMHMYVPVPPKEEAKPSPKGKAKAKSDQPASASSSSLLGKRKVEEAIDVSADDGDGEEELDMKWACKITVMRIMKKISKKEKIAAFLEDFGVPTRGSKEELAQSLAEQLHYETDDDEDD